MAASAAFLNSTSSIIWPVYQLALPPLVAVTPRMRNRKIERLGTFCQPRDVRQFSTNDFSILGISLRLSVFLPVFSVNSHRSTTLFTDPAADCLWQHHSQHHFDWRQSCADEGSSDSVAWRRFSGWLPDGLPWRLRIPTWLRGRCGFRRRIPPIWFARWSTTKFTIMTRTAIGGTGLSAPPAKRRRWRRRLRLPMGRWRGW